MVKLTADTRKIMENLGFEVRFVDPKDFVVRSNNTTLFVKKDLMGVFKRKANQLMDMGQIKVRLMDDDLFNVSPGCEVNYSEFCAHTSAWHKLLEEYAQYSYDLIRQQLSLLKNSRTFKVRFADDSKLYDGELPQDTLVIGASKYDDFITALNKFKERGNIEYVAVPLNQFMGASDYVKKRRRGVRRSLCFEYVIFSTPIEEEIDEVSTMQSAHDLLYHWSYSYANEFRLNQEKIKNKIIKQQTAATPKVVHIDLAAVNM